MVERINVFDTPQKYRENILQRTNLIVPERDKFNGKSLVCVFLTSYCGVGCPFCFFKSPSPESKEENDTKNRFNAETVDKFVSFANDANVGYLQICGGGEPFLEKEALLKCVEEIRADRIILVTSGSWAVNKSKAEKYLAEIEKAISKRETPARVSIRLSVSEGHSIRLKERPLINLLRLFEEKYRDNENFTLQLKTFEGDSTLVNYLSKDFNGYSIKEEGKNQSDDHNIIKIIPRKSKITLPSGYEVIVGRTKIFESSLKPNLNDGQSIENSIEIFDEDLEQSQSGYPSTVFNTDGTRGMDWIVEYDGNVSTWQNSVRDNLQNISEDGYDKVLDATIQDPLTLSYIEKGAGYRDQIIAEISPRTVKLAKAVSIRDYVGTLLFQNEKTRLYYTLRVLQDYIKDGRADAQTIASLPVEIQSALNQDIEELSRLYEQGRHSMLDQELAKEQSDIRFNDFLELVELGHYDLDEVDIERAKKHAEVIRGVGKENETNQDRRLTQRVMTQKTFDWFIRNQTGREKIINLMRHGETNFNVEGRLKGQNESIRITFTEQGLSQINDFGNQLRESGTERIFASDLERTVQTALIANRGLSLPISFHRQLRGLNMGEFQNRAMLVSDFIELPEIRAAFSDHGIPIPGGESINQLIERITGFIIRSCDTMQYKNLSFVTHGTVIGNVNSAISGEPYKSIDYCKLRCFRDNLEVLEYGSR
ncbi:histidine phosphatase family protein [Patescibacteria group bacterium]|nr:histidine phosphatase family protein [Patescibacteria group bacterium]